MKRQKYKESHPCIKNSKFRIWKDPILVNSKAGLGPVGFRKCLGKNNKPQLIILKLEALITFSTALGQLINAIG